MADQIATAPATDAPPDPAALEDALFAQLANRPHDRTLLRRCLEAVAPGDLEAGLEWALARQSVHPLPILSILDALAFRDGADAPRDRFPALLDAPALAPFRRAWDAIRADRPLDPADRMAIASDRASLARCFFHFVMDRPRLLPLASQRPADLAALEAEAIAVAPLHAFLAHDPAEPAISTPEWRERTAKAEAETTWVDRALATGRLTMPDPLTGEPRDAQDSLMASGRCLYRFAGQEPFFLVTGGPWNAPQGLYLPRRNLVLSFGGEGRGIVTPGPLANLLATYLIQRAAPAAPEPPPGFTLHLPPVDNLAHQLGNFLTGLERALRDGPPAHLAAIRFSGTEFFGPLAELFPELAPLRIERPRREQVVDPAPGDPARLVLPATGYLIPRSLTDRILAHMRRTPRARPGAVEPADIPRAPGAPVIWLALRVRGRAWIGQEEGFAHIIRHIHARRPDAVFLIDGYSFPLGEDGSSRRWADAVAALSAMAQRIVAAAPTGARVVDMVGNTMRESVLWAAETDAYLAPLGTTAHKVAWFSPAPGLVYAPAAAARPAALRSPGLAAAEISAPARLLIGTDVTETRPEVGPARLAQGITANVTLDAAEVAEALWQLLEPRFPAAPPPSKAEPARDPRAEARPAKPQPAKPPAKKRRRRR